MWGVAIAAGLVWLMVCMPLQAPKLQLRHQLLSALGTEPATAQHAGPSDNSDVGHKSGKPKTFVIGVNAAVDLIVPALPLLEALKVSSASEAANATAADLPSLSSARDLARCFAHHFSRGAAAERFFADAAAFAGIVEAARLIPGAQLYTGGNAALMAD